MKKIGKSSALDLNLLSMVALLMLLAGLFSVYAWSEKRIDQANDLRHRSFLLADELRQSSDDLTRMARTYVLTGDARYKRAYHAILNIRNGKQPRPVGYQNVYWDTELDYDQEPSKTDSLAIPLRTLMHQAGFTAAELEKLELANANSDRLTATETVAMALIESDTVDSVATRAKASAMMHDQQYHRDKAAIMQPIKEFNVLIDQRTLEAVSVAETWALVLRLAFVAFAIGVVAMVMHARR